MKITTKYLFTLLSVLFAFSAFAQSALTLSGTVTNEKGEVQQAATVFISGTTRIMPTDEEGRFKFTKLLPGNYQLSVKFIGYQPYTQNIVISNESVDVKVNLEIKVNELKEVVIGANKWGKHYKMFKDYFLGTTENAKGCEIINPRVLTFHYNKKDDLLTAEANDFLIVENRSLGYRIRYMLTHYSKAHDVVNHDGEVVFEELEGTDKMKAKWQKARAETYKGSFIHFLRAVYYNQVLKQGFVARKMNADEERRAKKIGLIDRQPIDFEEIAEMDNDLMLMRFGTMLVIYDPVEAARLQRIKKVPQDEVMLILPESTVLTLHLRQAAIDSRGNYSDYRTFLKQGYWGRLLVGDQLPFEYQPPGDQSLSNPSYQ